MSGPPVEIARRMGSGADYRHRPVAELEIQIRARRGAAIVLGLITAIATVVLALVYPVSGISLLVIGVPFVALLVGLSLLAATARIEIALQRDTLVIREHGIARSVRTLARRDVRGVRAGTFGERTTLHLTLADGQVVCVADLWAPDAGDLRDAADALRDALELD